MGSWEMVIPGSAMPSRADDWETAHPSARCCPWRSRRFLSTLLELAGSILHSPARLDGVRALVVDDDHDTREMLVELLALDSAVVFGAGSGAEGFQVFERERPDIVVSDLWMPGGDGYEMIRRIRALAPDDGGLTPAVAVSAAEAVRSALAAGFHAFAAKPFDIETLVEIIADFTEADRPAQPTPPWTIANPRPGRVVVTFGGQVGAGDMRAMLAGLLRHVEHRRCDLVVDLRGLTAFSPSVASVVERGVWDKRRRICSARIVGGPALARWVLASACNVLGIPSTIAEYESPE